MKIIERWKKSLYRKAVKHRLIAPQVIVLMDGGVCSQMHQYLLGRIFENGGHKVLYDLSFYEEWGTDMDYQFVRNFDLLKAFPYLKVKSASKLALSVYKKKYFNLGNNTYGRQPSQPCRRYDVAVWKHLATPDVVDELFVTCLPTSG